MKCPDCGVENLDGARDCSACGAALSATDPAAAKSANATWWVVGVGGVLLVAVIGLAMASGGGSGGGGGGGGAPAGGSVGASGTAGVPGDVPADVRRAVTSAATTDLELYRKTDYKGQYARMSESDRKQVTESEWVSRAKVVEESYGKLVSYTVKSAEYVDADKSVLAVEVEAQFTDLPSTIVSEIYYIQEGGRWVPSMLWGRRLAAGVTR